MIEIDCLKNDIGIYHMSVTVLNFEKSTSVGMDIEGHTRIDRETDAETEKQKQKEKKEGGKHR